MYPHTDDIPLSIIKALVFKRAVLVQFVTCKKSLIWQAFSLKELKILMVYLSTELYVNRHITKEVKGRFVQSPVSMSRV